MNQSLDAQSAMISKKNYTIKILILLAAQFLPPVNLIPNKVKSNGYQNSK